ncbi:hypothetical protein HAX54_041734 [Datura stramonium]|uniref:Uncharacterized protein n=1 Tax=Datura stramonium TaxID=4076 RepID=A0ABS8W222_DATST|nr:hypothetical protein [Datura stramonium]
MDIEDRTLGLSGHRGKHYNDYHLALRSIDYRAIHSRVRELLPRNSSIEMRNTKRSIMDKEGEEEGIIQGRPRSGVLPRILSSGKGVGNVGEMGKRKEAEMMKEEKRMRMRGQCKAYFFEGRFVPLDNSIIDGDDKERRESKAQTSNSSNEECSIEMVARDGRRISN